MIPPALTELFSTVAAGSWRAGWLVLALVAVRRLVRGRIPAQVWFAVWIVVALRLLLPVSLPASWSPFNVLPAHTAVTAPRLAPGAPTPMPVALPAPGAPTAPAAIVATEPESSPPAAPQENALPGAAATLAPSALAAPALSTTTRPANVPEPVAARSISWTSAEIATALWLAGVAILALARLSALARFHRRLRKLPATTDARLAEIVAREARQLGGAGSPACLETDAVDAPALFGILRPRLLFPPGLAAQLTDDELRLVVRHELAHWRRRDLIAQTLMQAAAILHWFNPLAWFAARLARNDCELACDEFVLRRETADGSAAYGSTLLKVLGVTPRLRRRPAASVGIFESKQQLAQRVRTIASYRAATRAGLLGGIALVAVLATASLTRESRAAAKEARPLEVAALASQPVPISTASAATEALPDQVTEVTLGDLRRTGQELETLRARVYNVQERWGRGPLAELHFIAADPRIAAVREKVAAQKSRIEQLRGIYTAENETRKTAEAQLRDLEAELQRVAEIIAAEVLKERDTKAIAYAAMKKRSEQSRLAATTAASSSTPAAPVRSAVFAAQTSATATPPAAEPAPAVAPSDEARQMDLAFSAAVNERKLWQAKWQIESIKAELIEMRRRYGPSFPSVIGKTVTLRLVEEDLPALEKAAGFVDGQEIPPAVRERARQLVRDWETTEARARLVQAQEELRGIGLDLFRDRMEEARARFQIIGEQRNRKKPLEDIPFIASHHLVAQLNQQLVTGRIELAVLRSKYGDAHAEVVTATKRMEQIERESGRIVENLISQAETDLEATERTYQRALSRRGAAQEAIAEAEARLRRAESIVAGPARTPVETTAVARPAGDFVIRIMGAVNQQGTMTFSAEDKPILLDVIAQAGGFAPNADRTAIRVVRSIGNGERQTLQVPESQVMGGWRVGANDVVVVPEQEAHLAREVSIIGAVNNPGTFILPEGGNLSIATLIAKAGGPSRLGDLRRVRVTRTGGSSSELATFTLDLSALQGTDTPAAKEGLKFELKRSDVVFVPEKIL